MARALTDSPAVLKGVGPKKLQALNKLGINTIEDLLTYYPFRYEDLTVKQLSDVADGEKVVLKGVIAAPPVVSHFGRAKTRLNFGLLVENDLVKVTFFNQGYLAKQLSTGQEVAIYGKYDQRRQSLTGMKVMYQAKDEDLAGVYRASKEITDKTIKDLVSLAYADYHDLIFDIVPDSLRQKFRLETRVQMIHDMHFPVTLAQGKAARRSAIFEEFFKFQLRIQLLKQKHRNENGIVIKYDNDKLRQFIKQLPFELTAAQKRVVNEICRDLHRPEHMNRLLQGDVGSGKTVVAALAMYAAVTAGYQTVLMAPTEILAQQHAQKLAQLFEGIPEVNVALLTSSVTRNQKAKQTLLDNLASGEINLLVGTHAVIQDNVNFKKLGLVVTDEQHRFGVGQRQALRQKGDSPDALAMTATPIPRTLAITTYGEMDVSIIDELPKGRQTIKTNWLRQKQFTQALDFMEQQLQNGSQAYVISPLIAESEMLDLQNATEIYEKLKAHYAGRYELGLLHGQLTSEQKDEVMDRFKAGELDVLVSTTVIEVGVDVPNATVMVILDADRFGLAQLHQLRGRVGRGNKQSYCLLVADPKSEYGIERMKTMVETTDGFVIAQKDLELRGPGDVLGKKQSGLPDFKIGDPVSDFNILQVAQLEVAKLLADEKFCYRQENTGLMRYLNQELTYFTSFD